MEAFLLKVLEGTSNIFDILLGNESDTPGFFAPKQNKKDSAKEQTPEIIKSLDGTH